MQVSVEASRLKEALKYPFRVVPSRPTVPALMMMKLEAGENTLSVTGTDCATTIVSTAEAEVTVPGEVLVPAKKFAELVNRLDGTITIVVEAILAEGELKNEKCKIRCGRSSYSLSTLPVDQFPATPQVEAEPFEAAGLHRIKFAAGHDESRPALTGIYFCNGRIAATDGTRLAELAPGNFVGQAVVPAEAVLFDSCRVALSEKQALFVSQNTKVYSRLIDAQFPDYSRVIPTEYIISAEIPTEEFISGLERAMILNSQNIKLDLEENAILITAVGEDGDGQETVPVKGLDGSLAIAFNPRLVAEGLKAIKNPSFTWKFTGPEGISCMEQDGWRYLVLPLRKL